MITGWLTRLIVVITLLAIAAFDGLSIVGAHFQASDDAQTAAEAGSLAYQQQHTGDAALAAATQALKGGDKLVPGTFSVQPDGTVTLRVRRRASSIVLHMWSETKSWDVVTADATVRADN
jgi:hypothetical protein